MAKTIAKGFSLVETLISGSLLALLSFTLIHTSYTLQDYTQKSEEFIQSTWQRKSALTYGQLTSDELSSINSYTQDFVLRLTDTNNDGIDDQWLRVSEPNTTNALEKHIIETRYVNGETLSLTHSSLLPR
ncbi:hypothetical protein J3L16_06445 [Alteromonas sp. 5E99-2]|uniref:hypothetical protein n=1 Tax=Alteromonas sp. 5E99-2 TaxID=2817683 RepID=UPI001A98CC5C|nr:hypothetical protein [Alteromonas sp. 5E99-2]MBO1255325.1 hypothetical protein [Alteromonas sp. 5E99-2]